MNENQQPERAVLVDMLDPTKAIGPDGKPAGPAGKYHLLRMAKDAQDAGDLKTAQMMYNAAGTKMPGALRHALDKPVTTGTVLAAVGVVAAVGLNEVFGFKRHNKGKAWPTITDGFKPFILAHSPLMGRNVLVPNTKEWRDKVAKNTEDYLKGNSPFTGLNGSQPKPAQEYPPAGAP